LAPADTVPTDNGIPTVGIATFISNDDADDEATRLTLLRPRTDGSLGVSPNGLTPCQHSKQHSNTSRAMGSNE